MKARHATTFEEMIGSMRRRLRPTKAGQLADRLRTCLGLDYSKTEETRLLKMLLQQVSVAAALAESSQCRVFAEGQRDASLPLVRYGRHLTAPFGAAATRPTPARAA
jgi:hypothetical protein